MPDIILNTTFNNPLLPRVPVYGFTDTFNRADSTTSLGLTSGEEKQWQLSQGAWGIISSAAYQTDAVSSYAVVDALATDGTLTTTVGAIGDANGGLVLRYVDATNLLRLNFRQSSGVNRLFLRNYVNGTATDIGLSAADKVTANGSTVAVTLAGTSVTVLLNGEVVITGTVPQSAATKHGMWGAGTVTGMRYNDIKFEPAA